MRLTALLLWTAVALVAGFAAWKWLESYGYGYGWILLVGAAVLVVFAAKD